MIILAKSSMDINQIECKLNIGCDGIEIQLLDELVNGSLGNYNLAKDVYDLKSFSNVPVNVVHSPLLSHYGFSDVNLESFLDSDFKMLDQVFYIANYFGQLQNKKVIVVVHSESDRDTMMLVSDTWKKVLNGVGCLLFKYPYTEIAIENVTPFIKVNSGDIHMCNNFHFDNIEMVRELRKQLNTDRVGTVLDICHAVITKRYMNVIYKEFDIEPTDDFELDTYFAKNKDYIKLVHLANTDGNGYGKGHGTPFKSNDFDELKDIIDLYYKYSYTCPVTLEVGESNYLVSDNYRVTRETLLKVLEQR